MKWRIKNIDRWVLKCLLFIAGFAVSENLKANHIIGGEVQYTHVKANKYTFTLTIYSDCNICEFNTSNCPDIKSLEIYASPEELGFAKKLKTIPITKVSRTDITPLCNSVKSSCVSGGTFPEGIAKWVFEGAVDFDTVSTDYCRFEVAIRVDSRPDAYAGGVNDQFYNFARINICSGQSNNSAEFGAPMFHLLPANLSFTYNLLATDKDGDSLSFHLVKAQKAWNQNVVYPTGRNALQPVSINCPGGNCALNKTSWPIEGSDIDEESGWMGFTPVTNGESGFLVIEVKEWRKISGSWRLMGITRRDANVEIINAANNAPKISTSSLDYFACAGNDFMLDLGLSDPTYNGVKDSVNLTFWTNLPGGGITKVPGSINQFDAYFSAPTKISQISAKPYYLTVMATDNHCPLTSTTYKTFSITVTGLPDVKPKAEYFECDKVQLKSNFSNSEYRQAWIIKGENNFFESIQTGEGEIKVPSPGKYYTLYQLANNTTNCIKEISDSIIVPEFKLMTSNLSWPKYICSNEEVTITADFIGGTAPFAYAWNGEAGGKSKAITLKKDSLIEVFVKDANGCRLSMSKTIDVFERLIVSSNDSSLCVPIEPFALNLINRMEIMGWQHQGNLKIQYQSGNGKFTAPFTFEPTMAGKNVFTWIYTDDNKCHYTGEIEIHIIDPVPTGIGSPGAICNNALPIDLNLASSAVFNDGQWTCETSAKAIDGSLFNPKNAGIGLQTLYYSKNYNGCLIKDTTFIVVHKSPDVSITQPAKTTFCSTDGNVSLQGLPATGQWTNNVQSPMPNLVSPDGLAKQGKFNAKYFFTVTDAFNGCKSTDSIEFKVNLAPQLDFTGDIELCEGDKFLLKPNPQNIEKLELLGDFIGLNIARKADAFEFNALATAVKTSNSMFWKIKGLEGCGEQTLPFTTIVRPRPILSLDGSTTDGCVPFTAIVNVQNLRSTATANKYTWTLNGNAISAGTIASVNIDKVGMSHVQVQGSFEGCAGEVVDLEIQGYPKPTAMWTSNPENRIATSDYSYLYFTDKSTSVSPYTMLWSFEKGLPLTSNKSSIGVDFPKDTGLYLVSLEITTTDGCKDVDARNIRIRPGLSFYAPNAFTPDKKGPNTNEEFKIQMDSVSNAHLTIRNRWGEIVFETESMTAGWDGNYLGKSVPAGLYVWEVEANTIYGIYVRRAGTVLLVR